MIKDFLLSFGDNIKQKTTNPFLGTLIIVWSVDNWEFIYTIFNFEKGILLKDKLIFISKYLEPKPFLTNLGICILSSIGVLISTYFLLNLSRLIINFYEKKVTPLIYKITDKNSIILRTEYLIIKKERDDLLKKYDLEREQIIKLQNEIERLEQKIVKLQEVQKSKEKETSVVNEQQDYSQILRNIIIDLTEKNILNIFDKLEDFVNNKRHIRFSDEHQKSVNYLLKLGLFRVVDNNTNGSLYEFTDLGIDVKNILMKDLLKK